MREVSIASGLSFSHISKIELGQLDVSADKFIRFCFALGIPPGILLESCTFLSRAIYHVIWLNDDNLRAWAKQRSLNDVERRACADFIAGTALVLSYLLKSSNPAFLLERIDFPVQEQKKRFADFFASVPQSEPPENRRALIFNLIADEWATLKDLRLIEDSFLEKYLELNKSKPITERKPWIPVPKQAYFQESAGVIDPLRKDIAVLLSSHNRDTKRRKSEKTALTNINTFVKFPSMKPHLPILLERLKVATNQRGAKSELAKFLGIPLVRVSQWLSGDREPGGETTLRLLEWVSAEEVQQSKNPERVSPRPGPKTRSRKTSQNENTKSNPRKK